MSSFENLGIHVPKLLIPKKGTDFSKWSVVACDQYTSEMDYWKKVQEYVGDKPSTLNIILPEVYLNEDDNAKTNRISKINKTMNEYITSGVFEEVGPGFVFIERTIRNGVVRRGLLVALDLEKYDYSLGSSTLIRASERTVEDRLPPRIKIRKDAPVELPHILVLLNDAKDLIISSLEKSKNKFEKIYDFQLMQNSGHIKGYLIDKKEDLDSIAKNLGIISDKKQFEKDYGKIHADKGIMMYAMGDGNHSLATAKKIWENLKKTDKNIDIKNNPARFALVELINVHDSGLMFEPIHRVVFDVDKKHLLDEMAKYFKKDNTEITFSDKETNLKSDSKCHYLNYIFQDKKGSISLKSPKLTLPVGSLQIFLDKYCNDNKKEIDYIHGDEVIKKLCKTTKNIGFFLESMEKSDFFKTVVLDGVLPRKTFSLGEADEKRFYIEARKIVP